MPPDPARLEELERTLVRLTREIAEARREFAELREATSAHGSAAGAAAASAGAPPLRGAPRAASDAASDAASHASETDRAKAQRPRWKPTDDAQQSTEQLIGRYATLAVGVLMIVLGASALVSWAVRNGMLGPWVRVVLGALLAVALAVTGLRLRERARSYSNALLALSLAVTHVVAWGAGPRLELVPPWASLLVANAASFALGYLALREGEERLLALGIGGALLTPYVMNDGSPGTIVLAAYGFALLVTAVRVIRANAWWYVTLIALLYTAVYTSALASAHIEPAWLERNLAEAFACAVAIAALRWSRPPTHPSVALFALFMMHVALWSGVPGTRGDQSYAAFLAAPEIVPIAVAGAALALYAVRSIAERWTGAWILIATALPSFFIGPAVALFWREPPAVIGAVLAVWAALFAAAAWFEHGIRRTTLATVSGMFGLFALTYLFAELPDLRPFVLVAYAVAYARGLRRQGPVPALIVSTISIAAAYAPTLAELAGHTGYLAPPFATLESLHVASAVVAAWFAAMLGAPRKDDRDGPGAAAKRVAWGAAGFLAFWWGHVELSQAFSRDASSFLLIFYYAACGVGLIGLGRKHGESVLRHIGLVLALAAAAMAVARAAGIANVALRVGSYLAAGAFLLGVAWLYRAEEGHLDPRR
jgi:uncharacterized membrane protein